MASWSGSIEIILCVCSLILPLFLGVFVSVPLSLSLYSFLLLIMFTNHYAAVLNFKCSDEMMILSFQDSALISPIEFMALPKTFEHL